jgi:hypothetical protein
VRIGILGLKNENSQKPKQAYMIYKANVVMFHRKMFIQIKFLWVITPRTVAELPSSGINLLSPASG